MVLYNLFSCRLQQVTWCHKSKTKTVQHLIGAPFSLQPFLCICHALCFYQLFLTNPSGFDNMHPRESSSFSQKMAKGKKKTVNLSVHRKLIFVSNNLLSFTVSAVALPPRDQWHSNRYTRKTILEVEQISSTRITVVFFFFFLSLQDFYIDFTTFIYTSCLQSVLCASEATESIMQLLF